MVINLDDIQRDRLRAVIEDAVDRHEEHLEWLASHPAEPDHGQQVTEAKQLIVLDKSMLELL